MSILPVHQTQWCNSSGRRFLLKRCTALAYGSSNKSSNASRRRPRMFLSCNQLSVWSKWTTFTWMSGCWWRILLATNSAKATLRWWPCRQVKQCAMLPYCMRCKQSSIARSISLSAYGYNSNNCSCASSWVPLRRRCVVELQQSSIRCHMALWSWSAKTQI